MKYFFLFIGLFIQFISQGQSCDQFPADCPNDGMIEATRDSDVCITNWIAPQEITMQNQLRRFITEMMNDVANKKKWQVYEINEVHGSGIMNEDNTKLLPFPFRPPYQYSISFVFIVNQDSLDAWRHWYKNDLLKQSNDIVDSYKDAQNNTSAMNAQQRYSDSANYYGKLMTRYITDHQDEYQKAITSNDAKGQKKYEDGLKNIQDKVDEYINKANGKMDEALSNADSKNENFQEYRKKKTMAYRNASTLRVSFVFNENITTSLDESTKLVKLLSVPNTSFSALFHNNEPDPSKNIESFLTSPDFAFLLFGNWNSKPDEYKSYHAMYSYNKNATDVTTVKKITSDKVQSISAGIEGTPSYINQFIQNLDTQKLNALIVNQ